MAWIAQSPARDGEIAPELVPLGRDRGLLPKFIGLGVAVNLVVVPAAMVDREWLIWPLCALLIACTYLVIAIINELLSDPVG